MTIAWQPTLLGSVEPEFDPTLNGARRRFLTGGAWVDFVPGWVTGADTLFDEIVAVAPWGEHDRWMYDRMVAEPRLTTRGWDDPPKILRRMADALSGHYGVDLSSISANLYRDGNDSVAWHGDRIGRVVEQTVVAILSLGEPRRFLLRPKDGGASIRFVPAAGDLLVLGGTCQRTWQHCVPKCAVAGPRVSVMFRVSY